MPRVKGVNENGMIRPIKEINLAEKEEVEIIYREKNADKLKGGTKLVAVDVNDLPPLVGIFSVGGDMVTDAERYYETADDN